MYALEWRKGNGVTICFKASALLVILGAWGKYFALGKAKNFSYCLVS
jgi:hypothetical protein